MGNTYASPWTEDTYWFYERRIEIYRLVDVKTVIFRPTASRWLDKQWGFALEEGQPFTAPIWMGEFGYLNLRQISWTRSWSVSFPLLHDVACFLVLTLCGRKWFGSRILLVDPIESTPFARNHGRFWLMFMRFHLRIDVLALSMIQSSETWGYLSSRDVDFAYWVPWIPNLVSRKGGDITVRFLGLHWFLMIFWYLAVFWLFRCLKLKVLKLSLRQSMASSIQRASMEQMVPSWRTLRKHAARFSTASWSRHFKVCFQSMNPNINFQLL